jgi:serine/threonine protein kinase/tetratricopeptide (TPR) repeat protein
MAEKPKDIEEIYSAALKFDAKTELSAYLDEVCGDNHALRIRVEALLKANEEAGDFLKMDANDPGATLDSIPSIDGPGTIIGRYELLELIGEGGMGLVYIAEQKRPVKRRVALKIIKPGMDSKQVIARFEAERQALALLDHPNIAHVFDAGTTRGGRPYFVMEYVKGMSITKYCDEYKLNIEERLQLFRDVCDGLHHAHQKGIIHRDIKPSNILVSIHGERAVPKIIDFGIAKATARSLTDKTMFTYQGQLLGTPEYMSPEQVDLATQDIDTRSDIYSLGVVLYELLAGVLPFESDSFRQAGFAEVQKTIREQEPTPPSTRLTDLGEEAKEIAASRRTQVITLARCLHRELEWIPLMAMRKDRTRRYRSASELADDIKNYLTGAPLIAGPETVAYRVKKFVHRHAGSVVTVAITAVAIILGLVTSTAMYFRAEQALNKELIARAEAERQAKISQAVAKFLIDDFLASVYSFSDGSGDVSLPLALGFAASRLEDRFGTEPLIEASIREALGKTYRRRGEYEEAEPHLERACQIRQEQLGEVDPSTLVSMNNLASIYEEQGRYEDAEALYVKTLEGTQRVLGGEHHDTLDSMTKLGSLYYKRGRYDEAKALLNKALEIGRRVLGMDDVQTQISMGWLAKVYRKQGYYGQAEPLYLEMLEIRHRLLGDEYDREVLTRVLMEELIKLYESWSKPRQAEQWRAKSEFLLFNRTFHGGDLDTYVLQLRDAWETKEEHTEAKQEPAPKVIEYMKGLAMWRSEQGRYKEAEQLYLESLEIQRHVLGETHQDVQRSMRQLTDFYYRQGRYDEVATLWTKMLEISRIDRGQDRASMADFMATLVRSQVHWKSPELQEVIKPVEAAIRACELTYWVNPRYINTLAEVYAKSGDMASAIKWQKEAIALLDEKEPAEQHRDYQARLKLYQSGKLYHKGFSTGDLVAQWEFNEVKDGYVIDSSGNGLKGKLIGDAKIISDPQRGNVLCLDGDGDYVDCGDNPAFDIVGSITISVWIKVNKFDRDYQAIITKRRHWHLQRHHQLGSTAFTVGHPETRGGWAEDEAFGNIDANDGKWHHIAGVYDGTNIYLYVDGVLDNFKEVHWLISVAEHPILLIGEDAERTGRSWNGLTGRSWNGLIDDVRIYNCAFSEAEIKVLYEGKALPRERRPED